MPGLLCPECHGSLRAIARRLDFFCAPCRLAISVLDEHWVQTMRPTDLVRQVVPLVRSTLTPRLKVSAGPPGA